MASYSAATRDGGANASLPGNLANETIDLVLVNAIEYFSKTTKIHPTKVVEGEELPEGFS